MMAAFLDLSSEVEPFKFFLAHELKKSLDEIEQMRHDEYLHWSAYFKVRQHMENRKGPR